MGILNEAFKELELLDDTSFDLNDEDDIKRLNDFLDDNEENFDNLEMIVDLDAETEDDLKDSYINDLILYCPTCQTMHFAKEEDIVVDEENPDIVDVGVECPHCKQLDGFEIVGRDGKYKSIKKEETEEETDNKDEEEVEVKSEEEKEEVEFDDDFIEESFSRFVDGDYSRSDYDDNEEIIKSESKDVRSKLDESFDTWKTVEKENKKDKLKESISIKAKEKRNAICEKFGVKNFGELKERFQGKGTDEEKENFVKVLESFGLKNVKFGKPLTEDNEKPLTKSPYKNIIGKQFDYTFDFDFLDIVADIIDRIDFDDYKEAEDKFDFVYEELDNSLIYTGDQWKVLQWYVSAPADLDSSSWTETLDSFTNELVKICDKIVADDKEEVEESLTESFNQAIQETWKGEDKIADLVERAESMYTDGNYGDMEDCVTQALDDGLIYSVDIWDLAEHYGIIDDSELIDRFYEDLWNDVYNEVYSNHEDDQDNEEVDESLKEGKSIKVEPGYHEWILKIDGEPYYSFGDISEEVDYYDDAESFAEDELSAFKDELNDDLENNPRLFIKEVKTFTDEDIVNFKNQLINAYNYYKSNIEESLKEDIDDTDKALDESCKNESVSERDDIDADADDKKEKAKAEDEKAIDDADADRDDKLNESQSQEIKQEYDKLSEINGLNFDELIYGENGFMKTKYPEGFSDFAGDVIFSEKYWNELVDWAKKEKGIDIKTVKDESAGLEELDESENVSAYTYARTGDIVEIDDKKYQIDWRDHKIGYSDIIDLIDLETKEPTTISKEDFIAKAKLVESKDNDCLEELDESIFDKLVNKYCNRVYENIDNYKTTSGSIENNQIVLEGLITFKSGKTSPTKFVFESVKDEKGTRLIGLNETFSKGKKSFKLKGNVENKQFIAESLTYNYKTKINEETKTIYGRVINNKK